MGRIEKELGEFVKELEDEELKLELGAQLMVCAYYHQELFDFMNMGRENHVYWTEMKNKGATSVQLNAAPLDIGAMLREILFRKDFPVILTSATLSVCGKLDYYSGRVGYEGGEGAVLDSPFDFMKQAKLFIPRMPNPDADEFFGALCENIELFVAKTHGKAFVLFTSYDLLKRCATATRPFFEEKGITLLVQGEGKSTSSMLSEFKSDIDSVIFGTNSFWMGVDVPGEALSSVIITKLPFSVPDHPLIQARAEKIESQGGSSFRDYSLPEAVLRFRQGIGRLIRTRTDKGIIVILDGRVRTKSYGRYFIDSIPKCPIENGV
jgi:ATP-dependent DNA helicase DinG